jgi:glycosyltransferase involved in cell wall biosynthesis
MMARTGTARRVLIIVQNLPVPFDRRVWLEATSLTSAGYEVSVICPKAKGFNRSFERLEGVDIYRYGLPIDAKGAFGFIAEFLWCFLRSWMKSLRVAVRGRGFDVIHACNPPETYWLLAWFWRPFGKRFLFDHHDLSPEMYAAKFDRSAGAMYRGLLFLERMTFRTADQVITTNESHKRIAVERGQMAPEQVHIVRSGPDLARFKRYPKDPAWRKGRRHLVVYLGEICKQDGVDYMLRALKDLRDVRGRDDIQAVFVGGGPHQPEIKAYAATLGLSDMTTFTGRVSDEDLCRILSSADIGIDPDPKNDWSDKSTMNKIMEYMYFGLPIVAFDLRETRFSAQEAALYAAANSETAMASLIAQLLDDEPRRRLMADFGQRRLRESLAWEHSVPVLLGAYDALFAGAGSRRHATAARLDHRPSERS